MPNGDVKLHFEPNPASPSKRVRKAYDLLVLDFEQNAVRDTAIHWQMMDTVYKEKPFAMDPFASEYLSEVLSTWMTVYLRRGETVAKELGKKEIDQDVARKIRDKDYVSTMPRAKDEQAAWTPEQQQKKDAALARYKAGLFRDVTKDSGLPAGAPKLAPPDPAQMDHGIQQVMGAGIGVGDVDKDGYPDLFVAGEGFGRLYVNKGKAAPGKFTDATEVWGLPAGLDDAKHPIFFDMDGDGDLDLLVVRSEHPSILFKQEAGKFGPGKQQVVGPLEGKTLVATRNCPRRACQRHTCNKAQLRASLRRPRIDQQQACVEIAGRRGPDAAMAATTDGLLARDNP